MKKYKNASRTERWIREAFAELVAERKSLDKITVTDIAKKADITKQTFYYHYSDLNDLIRSIENEMIDMLSAILDKASENANVPIEHYISILSSFLKKNENEYRFFASSTDMYYFISKAKKLLAKKLDNPSFGFSSDAKTRSIQRTFISGACVDVLCEYFKGNIQCSLEDVEKSIVQAINKLKS